jgi:aminopeptidase N
VQPTPHSTTPQIHTSPLVRPLPTSSSLHRWYSQAGTPHLNVSTCYDAAQRTYTVRCKQHTPPSPGQATKLPVLVPLRMGLLGPDGAELQLSLRGRCACAGPAAATRLCRSCESWVPARQLLASPAAAEPWAVSELPRERTFFQNVTEPARLLALRMRSSESLGTETVLRVTEAEQEFVFEGVEARVLLSC